MAGTLKNLVGKTVKLTFLDGDAFSLNAFSLMGAFKRAARKQGWNQAEIETVLKEAKSGDYNHLLATLLTHTEDE